MQLTNHALPARPRPALRLVTADTDTPSFERDPDVDVLLDGARLLLTQVLVDPVACQHQPLVLCRHRACVTAAIRRDPHRALDALDLDPDAVFAWLDQRAADVQF